FFPAEDGIRDGHVTGVQTCALPICLVRLPTFVCIHVHSKRTTNGHECTRMWAGELSRIEQKTTKIREGSRNHKSEIINQKFPFLPSFPLFASVKSFRGSAYSFAPIRLPLNPVFRIPDPAF